MSRAGDSARSFAGFAEFIFVDLVGYGLVAGAHRLHDIAKTHPETRWGKLVRFLTTTPQSH